MPLPHRANQRDDKLSRCVAYVAKAQDEEDEEQLIERVRDSLTVAHMHGQDCTYVHDGLDFHLMGVGSVSVAI